MSEKYLIIGDGIAGATAAKTIRENDEDADIKVFTDDSEPLYNRIMLKTYMKGRLPKQYTRMHDKSWYEKRNIDLHLDTKVESVDTGSKVVETCEGSSYKFDKVLVATGGSPRKLPEDEGFENIHYMWTIDDAERIKNDAEEVDKAVVVGGGLLGIDLAVAYAENDVDTYYLVRGETWWGRGLDTEGASIIHDRLEEKGCNVLTETSVSELEGSDGEAETVLTDSGDRIECDSVAVAIGQTPNSGLVDVSKNDKEMVRTDEYLQTSNSSVYAAGNMVEYKHRIFGDKTVNGSWDHSERMGECAAENMLGENNEFDYINTYGVGHFDAQFLAIGDWTGEPVSRRYNDSHYRRLFFRDDRVVGAVLVGFTKGQERIKEMIKTQEKIGDKEKLLDKEYWK